MRPRCTSGQASVEYIALVALAALVFAIAGAFTLQGRAIAAAAVAQLRRGLCIVAGHDCADPVTPCSVSSRGSGSEAALDVGVVRLGGGRFALVDHRSDGKVLVTVTDHVDGSVSFDVGGRLRLNGKPIVGAEARAAALASLGHGTTYAVQDDSQADALLRLVRRPKVDPNLYTPAVRAYWRRVEAALPRIPEPLSRYRRLEGGASLSLPGVDGTAIAGVRDDAGGGRTYYLKGSLSLDATAGPRASGDASIAISVDRHGRPLDLALVASGALERSIDLPASLQEVAGHVSAGRGRSWELEGHLDLTRPGSPAVGDLIAHPRTLERLMLDAGYVQVRSYASAEREIGVEGRLKAGFGLGAGLTYRRTSQRLLAALDHTREGFWVPRYDCLAAT